MYGLGMKSDNNKICIEEVRKGRRKARQKGRGTTVAEYSTTISY